MRFIVQSSIRDFRRPAGGEERDVLLAAARRAPTAAMMHSYSIIDIQDEDIRTELNKIGGSQKCLHNSSLLMFCVDRRRAEILSRHLRVETSFSGFTALLFGAVDATLAAANLLHAAHELGLGCCIVGTYFHRAEETVRALSLPAGVLPLFGIAYGLPAENPTPRPRFPLQSLVHRDGYQDPDEAELAGIIASLATWSGEEKPLSRSPEESAQQLAKLLTGAWWTSGEESLRRALEAQVMMPSRTDG